MKTSRIGTQNPLLILPSRFKRANADASSTRHGEKKGPGMSAFNPWCYVCNKAIFTIAQKHEGEHMVAWEAKCHGDSHCIEIVSDTQFEYKSADTEGRYRPGEKIRFLTFFAPETYYGGETAHWNPGRK